MTEQQNGITPEQRRGIRTTTVIVTLVVVGFYVAAFFSLG